MEKYTTPVPVDMELKKAFEELQVKYMDTTQKLKAADAQIESLKRGKHHTGLTKQEISDVPEATPLYRQIGRLFVLTEKSDMLDTLEDRIKHNDSRIQDLENNKRYLDRSMKESEGNLRELVQAKQRDRM